MVLQFDTNWEDMSDYVVHFTKPHEEKSDYANMLRICYERTLKAVNPFGVGKGKAPPEFPQNTVCFSEIPLHRLKRLAHKRGGFAIGFTKSFLVSLGGGPVLYAYKGTPHQIAIQKLMSGSLQSKSGAEVWKLTPFIDSPGNYGKTKYFFEWEREWRHVGDMKFETSDAAFLIIPEHLHAAARAFFEDARDDSTGPAYLCPYIDTTWSADDIRVALS